MRIRQCVVCNKDISRDTGRCTNSCCASCHARFCSPGGITSPGHGIDIAAAKMKLAAHKRQRCQLCGESFPSLGVLAHHQLLVHQ